jgi:2,4-dienoyl-CoA reductase-like NADH-dependent reductase (Old Yellow Enzyme family)
MSRLFEPLRLRDVTFRNRVFLSPMCQYSARDGLAGEWHRMHYGARAAGGVGLVMVEATAVAPEGRISPGDLGLWNDAQAEALAPLAAFVRFQGAVAGIQLAHAGRKGSCDLPWLGGAPVGAAQGGWPVVGPSPVPFGPSHPVPRELGEGELDALVEAFAAAARRALAAGFQVAEVHMAHGYLLHEFLSPLSNRRADAFGGDWENRARFPLRVAEAVRRAWPAELPLFARVSATDWMEGGWTPEDTIRLARALKSLGVDLVDCSAGGLVPEARPPEGPGYQVPFAAAVRREAGVPTAAVGYVTAPAQAEQIVATGLADAVCLGRELLRNPSWPLAAALALGAEGPWPLPYLRARPAPGTAR